MELDQQDSHLRFYSIYLQVQDLLQCFQLPLKANEHQTGGSGRVYQILLVFIQDIEKLLIIRTKILYNIIVFVLSVFQFLFVL